MALIESVPNFSEGRDPAILGALRDALQSVAGAWLLDVHADPDHHRSVFTLVGSPERLAEALSRGARCAVQRIDLRRHEGEHPRMGAVDVVPFVPLEGAEMADCVALAERVGRALADELDLPVFLYGAAARHPGRPTASDVRRHAFDPWVPDVGPSAPHPTAGAAAVGARDLLVAFNVLLDTDDVAVARRIARRVRAANGGLPAVQARGFRVGSRAQVSMNLLDVNVTPPLAAFQAVEREAAALGIKAMESEIVGLAPERVLGEREARLMRLAGSVEDHYIERRIRRATVEGEGRRRAT